jgi:hypothetical protein
MPATSCSLNFSDKFAQFILSIIKISPGYKIMKEVRFLTNINVFCGFDLKKWRNVVFYQFSFR